MIDVSGTYIEFLSSVKSVYRVYQNIKPFSRGEKQEKTAIKQEKTAETQDVVLPPEKTTTNCVKIVLKKFFIIIFALLSLREYVLPQNEAPGKTSKEPVVREREKAYNERYKEFTDRACQHAF